MFNLITSVQAQTANAAAGGNPLMQLAPFAIIFIIFYFLMIRPQKKRLEEEQAMLSSLSKGAEVYTKAGLLGKIAGITDKVVTLEVSEGTKIKVLRSQIGGLSDKIFQTNKK